VLPTITASGGIAVLEGSFPSASARRALVVLISSAEITALRVKVGLFEM